jgi:hypothetical protein
MNINKPYHFPVSHTDIGGAHGLGNPQHDAPENGPYRASQTPQYGDDKGLQGKGAADIGKEIVDGISSVPAAATRAEPIPKVIIVIRLLLTPMRVAASLSWAVARIHRPRSVFNRNKKAQW